MLSRGLLTLFKSPGVSSFSRTKKKENLLSSDSGYREKVDALDLIIQVLRDHEKTLDELIGRLEEVFERFSTGREAEHVEKFPAIRVEISNWKEFRSKCSGASMVAFEKDERVLSIFAVKEGVVHTYSEALPVMNVRVKKSEEQYVVNGVSADSLHDIWSAFKMRLRCGLEGYVKGSEVRLQEGTHLLIITYDVDAEEARQWLSKELNVDKKKIVQGKITI